MRALSRLHRPRTARGWTLTGVGVAAAAVAGFFAVYLILFSGSSPAALVLTPARSSAPPALTWSQLPGTWSIAPGSVAGYRVREQLAFLGAPSDAVGRTSAITGTATITASGVGATVSAASFTVDVSKLTSDKQMRDGRIHRTGLQSDRFPTATFALSTPVALDASAASGAPVPVSLAGALTIHGTTRTVSIPTTARLTGSTIELVGSVTFPFEQFGMTPPSIGGFVTLQDNATMEFDIRLQKG